ncbi:hypothetical protein MIND_00254600 [Mycena indigotica]|uniref:Uncharacterized protein n=1 Tax=Mycena indigotica TaxID=2126181 RepID=A0A8H6T7L7_9AGAR|nr:uncharacterized protein MIND_00254600 [Mycena indigotica]KAF7312411.1 hypothetical protein MIND_00254600 [Mycena indigotica]
MDPLAAKLNELAVANSDGLLNDDEYRILRQNLFERYTTGVDIISSSPPVVKSPRRKHVELMDPTPAPSPRQQQPVARSKMSEFLRRATGRKAATPPSSPVIKLSMPRLFSKKHEDVSSSDTESSVPRTSSGSRRTQSSRKISGSISLSPSSPNFRSSPTRSYFDTLPTSPSRSAFPATPSRYDVVPGGSNDIFDDENLHTSDAIRKAISAVEADSRRLVAAFNDLETSAVIRYRQEHPHRNRSGSSSNLNSTPSRRPPIIAHGNVNHHRARSNSQRNIDGQSVRSSTSLRTTKSTASLFASKHNNPTPPPPLSQSTPPSQSSSWGNRISALRRKGSLSSLSSSQPSFLSVGRSNGLSRSSSISRSTSHLPLPPVPPSPASPNATTMMELLKSPTPDEGGEELADVRRRRTEVVGRCEARLEYLRAKLKTAELHEKLLRK